MAAAEASSVHGAGADDTDRPEVAATATTHACPLLAYSQTASALAEGQATCQR